MKIVIITTANVFWRLFISEKLCPNSQIPPESPEAVDRCKFKREASPKRFHTDQER